MAAYAGKFAADVFPWPRNGVRSGEKGEVATMTSRIYTRKGDDGRTGLVGGARVSKDDPRVEAYGAVDELNAWLGLAAARCNVATIHRILEHAQGLMFELGAQLATPPGAKRRASGIGSEEVAWVETEIDTLDDQLPPLTSFILPGGTEFSATLQLARAVCRRAERRLVSLQQQSPEEESHALHFLNRFNDLLFVLARLANAAAGHPEIPWPKAE